jgi:hypothetical protein
MSERLVLCSTFDQEEVAMDTVHIRQLVIGKSTDSSWQEVENRWI